MKRTLALWGTALSLVVAWESPVFGQEAPPVSAADDTLTTTGEEVAPPSGPGPTEMQQQETARRRQRRQQEGLLFYISLGIGSAINYLPHSFNDSYDPSLGLRLGGGVSRDDLSIGFNATYNFFLSNEPTTIFPNDFNVLTVFGEVKYAPLGSTVRPYILACGGYWRQWVVNASYEENVLGYGGGAGVEVEIDRSRHLFIEGRHIQGRTRQTERRANTEVIPFTLGVIWIF